MKFLESAVFAHYMVGTITEEQAHKDVMDAHALGLDAFALNSTFPSSRHDFYRQKHLLNIFQSDNLEHPMSKMH